MIQQPPRSNETPGSPPPTPNHNNVVPYMTSPTLPSIPLYPTGKAALIPTPMTYELIPNRIFVGGFPTSTTETELREHFDAFFPVKDVKMVKSLDGISKGYGFITFESEDQAEAIRKLNPKQLEFRNRKLNLGPAIRNINTTVFPPGFPGYLIATPSPSPYPLQGSPQVFVYPSVINQEPNKSPESPQMSPQPQVFFPEQQEPVRTYANAVSGAEKSEQQPETAQKQPIPVNNGQQYPQQWNGPEIVELPPSPVQYPNYPANNGNENNQYQPMQVPVYYPSTVYHPPSIQYMGQPMTLTPYYPPQVSYHSYVNPNGPNHNGYHQPQQQQQPLEFYPMQGANGNMGGYPQDGGQQHQQHEENSFSRPLQAPRAGKKHRKASERMNSQNTGNSNNNSGNEKAMFEPRPMRFYMNSQGMYHHPNYNYMTPPPYHQQGPYWIQPPAAHQQQHGSFGGYNHNNNNHQYQQHHQNHQQQHLNGYGDAPPPHHHQQQHHQNHHNQQEAYYGGGGGGYHGGNDENAFPRPHHAAKKSWKESLEKRKSPVKGTRTDKSTPSSRRTSTSSPTGAQKLPSLTDSMQSLTVSSTSSPAKN